MENTMRFSASQQRPRARASRGFTLAELLVVIGVIGVVAAFLLPALHQAQNRSKTVVCLDNLKQLQLCWLMYAHDNNDVLTPNNFVYTVTPGSTNDPALGEDEMTWCRGIAPLDTNPISAATSLLYSYNRSQKIYHCPADAATIVDHPDLLRKRSYNLSNSANCSSDTHFRKYNEIHVPTSLFIFIEADEDDIWDSTFGVIPGNDPRWSDYWLDIPTDRHQQGANLTFADGHAEPWTWQASKKGLRIGQKTRSRAGLQDLRRLQQHIKGAGGN